MGMGEIVLRYAAILLVVGLPFLLLILARRRRERDRRGRTPPATPPAVSPAESQSATEPQPAGPPPAHPSADDPFTWATRHWRALAVVLLLALLLAVVWILTPPAVTPPPDMRPLPDRPFVGFQRIWRFLRDHVPTWLWMWPLANLSIVAGLGILAWWQDRLPAVLRAGSLLAIVALGVEGQLFLLDQSPARAILCYGLALVGFVAWLRAYRPEPQAHPPAGRRMTNLELGLLALILALAAFARFYALPRIPYGIEGDESKWTIEVVSVMLDHRHTLQSVYHYATQPVSFYMQAPFHHLLGESILSARIAVASYSLLAMLAFYWLVRQTLGVPAALLATTLLSVSLVDVSASRMALVEGHVKLWAVAGLAFTVYGLRVRRPLHSFLGGLALALGLLTYDTLLPVVGVALTWALLTLIVQRASLRESVLHLTALLVPVLLVTPFVVEYLAGRMSYYSIHRIDGGAAPARAFLHNLEQILRNFWVPPYGDFLFVRSGPILNGLLLPFLALGLVLAWRAVRRPAYALPALWFVLLFFPVPIFTGASYVRVFYPGFPAIYVLVALAALLVWREVTAAFPDLRPAFGAAAGLALAGLIGLNIFLYFNDLGDPIDRQRRRELADVVIQATSPDRRTYVPYFPESDDAIQYEQELFLLEARGSVSAEELPQRVWTGAYEELLPTLAQESVHFEDVALVVNHSIPERQEELRPVLDALERCAGLRLEREGRWFSLYVAEQFDLQAARCAVPRVHLEHTSIDVLQAGESLGLEWWMEDAAGPGEAHLQCEQLRPGTIVVEAENMLHDDTWHQDRRFVADFRGRGYLADHLGLGSATFTFTLPFPDTYSLWVRTYRRTPDPYPLLLTVDGEEHRLQYEPGEPVQQWIWQRAGTFPLGEGIHTLRMTRPVHEYVPDTLALFVDALILVPNTSFDPAEDRAWEPFLERNQNVNHYVSSGRFLVDDWPVGEYRCWVTVRDAERLLDWDGQAGARSNVVEFRVVNPGEME